MLVHRLRGIFLPATFLVFAFFTRPALEGLPEPYVPLIRYLPIALMLAAMAFAWRFNRGRVFFSLLALVLGYGFFQWAWSGQGPFVRELAAIVLGLLLPVSIALYGLLPERGIFGPRSILRWLILLAQAAFVGWLLISPDATWLARLSLQPLLGANLDWTALPADAAAILGIATAIFLARYLATANTLDVSLLGALGAVAFARHYLDVDGAAVFFAAAAFTMIAALIQASYGMAYLDELTGLPGRRALREALQQLGSSYTVAMLDVDHFKRFNDTYGHDVGDQVLRMVASKLQRISGGGRPYRYGGEEFTVLFPGKIAAEAQPHLEALRGRIEKTAFAIRGKNRPKDPPTKRPRRKETKRVSVTVSIGLAERGGDNNRPEAVIKAADQALYRAKRQGRNRVSAA